MTDKIKEFQEYHPSIDSYWRSIILFGRNVATYKFALAKALIDLRNQRKTHVTLNELAVPYSKYICEHVNTAPRQATSRTSKFIQACTDYNDGKIGYDQLINTTVSLGFNNVIDAFHNVNNAPVPVKFFDKNYTKNSKEIVLTDELYKLNDFEDLTQEADARWSLVETAWQLGIKTSLLDVKYDNSSDILFVDESLHRKDVTSARDALNGYQKGHCFYCFDNITVIQGMPNSCDVDHFFPYALQRFMPDVNLDGVWNLVLA